MRKKTEDIDLINSIKSKDSKYEQSFKKLYNRYNGKLRMHILKKGIKIEIAKDLVTHTFEKVYLNIDKYDSEYAFATWLFRIGSNIVIDYRRKKSNYLINDQVLILDHTEGDDDNMGEPNSPSIIPTEHKTPQYDFMILERNAKLLELINAIDSRYRIPLLDVYFGGLTYEEGAKKNNMNIGTFKTSVFKGKAKLKSLMEKTGFKEKFFIKKVN